MFNFVNLKSIGNHIFNSLTLKGEMQTCIKNEAPSLGD